ncbi:MAG: TetR/AcrR family transcriptional regulator [Oscillospiraceae bacterium]|nr:TetR/AcrR family transcriptional regulator [Oscillospiraceae bacterium]
MSSFTKDAIKQTFLLLLDEKPLNQITVKLIVETCGINRNSFYYHYPDLPALIEEIIREEGNRIMQEYPTIETIEMAMQAAVDFAAKNRRAILHIYHSVNRDIFEQYLWQVCEYVVSSYGRTVLQDRQIDPQDQELIGRFYVCECFGVVIDWLNHKMESDIQARITRFCSLQKGLIEEMIRRSTEE